MRLSMLIRQHRALVAGAVAVVAALLVAAPVPAAVIVSCGAVLGRLARWAGTGRRPRHRADGTLGGSGYLEAGPAAAAGRDGE